MIENNNNNQINEENVNQIVTTEENNVQINKQEQPEYKPNKKNLIIIISAVIALIIIIVILIVVMKKSGTLFPGTTSPDDNPPTMTEEEKQEYMDQLNSQEGMNLSQQLYTYAIEIYENKKYENLPLDEKGVYVATKYELMLMNYDVSLIDEKCPLDKPIIYFDIEHKMNDSYEFEPIVYNVFCD